MTENTLLPEPLDRAFLLDPFPFYAKMRREAPVAAWAEGSAFVAFSFEAAQRVLSDYETFSSKVPFPPEMKDGTQLFQDYPTSFGLAANRRNTGRLIARRVKALLEAAAHEPLMLSHEPTWPLKSVGCAWR